MLEVSSAGGVKPQRVPLLTIARRASTLEEPEEVEESATSSLPTETSLTNSTACLAKLMTFTKPASTNALAEAFQRMMA